MKKLITNIPVGKMDLDSSIETIATTDYRYAENYDCNNLSMATLNQGSNVLGNTKIDFSQPPFGNKVVGRATYPKQNAEIIFVSSGSSFDQIRMVTESEVKVVLQASWLDFTSEKITSISCYDDYVIWTQGGEVRNLNIQWALKYREYTEEVNPFIYPVIKDFNEWQGESLIGGMAIVYNKQMWHYTGSDTTNLDYPDELSDDWTLIDANYSKCYWDINSSTILLLAIPPKFNIRPTYGNDETYESNNLYGKLFKFAYRYEYIDGRKSVYSPLCEIPFPQNEETVNGEQIQLNVNNVIDLEIYTGGRDVAKIDIVMIEASNPSAVKIIDTIEKYDKNHQINKHKGQYVFSDSYYKYRGFYNNEKYIAEQLTEVYKLQDYLPPIVKSLGLTSDGRVLIGQLTEGMNVPSIDITAEVETEVVDFDTPSMSVSSASYSSFYDTRGESSNIQFNVLSVTFPATYKKGYVFKANIKVDFGTTTTFNEVVEIPMPYYNSLTNAENKDEAIKYVAGIIRQRINDSSKNIYITPSDYPDEHFCAVCFEWNQYYYRYPNYYDSGGIPFYEASSSAHRGSDIYRDIPLYTRDSHDIVIMSQFVGFARSSALIVRTITVDITSITIELGSPKYETLKSKSRLNVGIVYKDKYLRPTGVVGVTGLDTGFIYEGTTSIANNFTINRYLPKVIINNLPPEDAYYYSVVVSEDIIINDYIEVIAGDVTINSSTVDIAINEFLTVQRDNNNKFRTADWIFQQGDRIRLLATASESATNVVDQYAYEDKMDVEILSTPSEGVIRISKPLFTINKGDLFEVYRLKKGVDTDNDIYYEVGNSIEIGSPTSSLRYHKGLDTDQVVEVDAESGIIVSTTPASSVVTYGNAYLLKKEIFDGTAKSYSYVIESDSYSEYYISDFYDKGKPYIISDSKKVEYNRLRYGGKLLPDSGLNYINRFDFADYDDLFADYGDITAIRTRGYTMIIFQEHKTTSYYVNKTVFSDAEGNDVVALSDKVLNNKRVSEDDYGCINPESITQKGSHILFFDANNKCFVRSSKNGMVNISEYGIMSYTTELGEDILANGGEIVGGYNERNNRFYWLTEPLAISFDDRTNQWKSFHDFKQAEYIGSLNNYMTGYLNGDCYIFNSANYNELFDDNVETIVQPVVNGDIGTVKVFDYITISSSSEWKPNVDGDIVVDEGKQQSRIRAMREKEGRYTSEFKRNTLYPNGNPRPDENSGEVLRGESMKYNLRTSGNTKKTITSSTVGVTMSEKII